MPPVQRAGDPNSAGGAAGTGVASVRVNGRPIVVDGTSVAAHAPWPRPKNNPHPPHASASTSGGLGSVKAGGIPINVDGNADTCGHARTAGSNNVRAGG